MSEAVVALKSIPEDKIIHIQEPVRDLAQLQDNLVNTASPLFLMHNSLTATFNQPQGKASPFIINGFEAPSGAQPEVNAQKAVPTLLSIERQGAYLPDQTPRGDKFILAFLARALSAFTREARERSDRKEQFKLVAERAGRNGQVAKISVFDALNRAEWVREDYEIIYELRAEGLPIVIEGVVPVSDDKKLTKDQFRNRVRALLELDNEIRQQHGQQTSAMHSLALKNTDGRLRGDDVGFSEGNAGDYGVIQWEEMDEALARNGAGPKEARLHTHDIGRADATAQSYINRYLEAATKNRLSICVDGLAGGYGFPDIEKVGNGLREVYGWNIKFSAQERAVLKRKSVFLGKGVEPFARMLDYIPSQEEEQLFECAPAALRSGMRLGTQRHARALYGEIASGKLPRREGESIEAAQKRMERGLIRTWGMLNAASKRMLANTYSITPVANHHNLVAGDLTGQALDIARQAYLDTEHGELLPLKIAPSEWDALALQSFSVVEQTPAAGYLTRADADIELSPQILEHLCRIRTAAVLPEDQASSFLALSNEGGGRTIADYAALRAALLANVMDKDASDALLKEVGVEPHLRQRYVVKYAGKDESLPGANVASVMTSYGKHIDKLLEEGRLWDGWDKADLESELRFAAITLGAKGLPANLQKLKTLAEAPGHAHDNIGWWEGVTPKNHHELTVSQVMKANGVNSFEKLFEKDQAAAERAGRYYVQHMDDFRVDFGFTELIMHRPRPPDNNQLWGDVWPTHGGQLDIRKLPARPVQARDVLADLEACYLRGAGATLVPREPWPGLTQRPWFSPQRFTEKRLVVA